MCSTVVSVSCLPRNTVNAALKLSISAPHATATSKVPSAISHVQSKLLPRATLKCVKPYPWTQAAMEKVGQLINESEFSTTEKQETKADLDLIIKNTPGAKSAARRTHKRLAKMGGVLRVA